MRPSCPIHIPARWIRDSLQTALDLEVEALDAMSLSEVQEHDLDDLVRYGALLHRWWASKYLVSARECRARAGRWAAESGQPVPAICDALDEPLDRVPVTVAKTKTANGGAS